MPEWTRLTKKQRSGGVMAYREEFGDHAIAQGEFYEDKFDMYKYGQRVSLTPAELLALATVTEVWREVAEVQALVAHIKSVEWVSRVGSGGQFCPWCQGLYPDHNDNCARRKVLAPFEEAK